MVERAPARIPAIPGFSYVRPLGSGGFAQVYLYEQDMPRRVVAVKVLNAASNTATAAAQLREVFESEADVMARLSSHPSVVSIYQASISLDGLPYLAMEYCPESMGARTKGNPAQLQVVLDAGVRIAGALETAHKAGVLHRDIKPSNVLLTTLGRPVLADFGISQVIGRQENADVAMSIPWSAPEVVQLQSSGDVASEVWSLGATLYSFAAGRSPFELADKTQNTRSKLTERITKAVYPAIPGAQGYEQFDELISHALRKNPQERYASMAQFGEALQNLQRHHNFDVTPLEVVAESWLPRSGHVPTGTRGPVVTTVAGRHTRAEARAAALAHKRGMDSDGLVLDRPASPLRAGLIGAGVALAGVAGLAAVAWAIWGGGR